MPDDTPTTQVSTPGSIGAALRPRWFERHDILGGISVAVVLLCAAIVWWLDRRPELAPQGRWVAVVAEERQQISLLSTRERLLSSQAAGNVCELDRPAPPRPPPRVAPPGGLREPVFDATVVVMVYPRPSPGVRRLAHHQLGVLVAPNLVLTDPSLVDIQRPDLADPRRVEIFVASAASDSSSPAAIVPAADGDRAAGMGLLLRIEQPFRRIPRFLKVGPVPSVATDYLIAVYPHGRFLAVPFPAALNERRYPDMLPPPEVVRERLIHDNFVLLSRGARELSPADSGAAVVDACGRLVGMVMRRPPGGSPVPFPTSNVVVPAASLAPMLASRGVPVDLDDKPCAADHRR